MLLKIKKMFLDFHRCKIYATTLKARERLRLKSKDIGMIYVRTAIKIRREIVE